jgi:solute carrier family 25 (mitochondrial folate transporter), member 32
VCPSALPTTTTTHTTSPRSPFRPSLPPQVQDGVTVAVRYRTIGGAMGDIWRSDGARGFYRGLVAAMWGSGLSWGLYFYFYESSKRRILENGTPLPWLLRTGGGSSSASPPAPPRKLSAAEHMYAAWEGGTLTCFVTNPLWLVKTRMQLQTNALKSAAASVSVGAAASASSSGAGAGPVPYRGLVDALGRIVREEGVRGLYKGLVPALFLTSHGMVQFGVYEELKARIPVPGASSSSASSVPSPSPSTPSFSFSWATASAYYFVFGAVSKAAATTATYPYQVVKSRMQQRLQVEEGAAGGGAASSTSSPRPYGRFLPSVQTIWRNEGARGFYKGFAANLLRVAPQSAVTLVAYEEIKRVLEGFRGGREG